MPTTSNLEQAVKDRIPATLLEQLTNAGDPSASGIDNTILGKAADDAAFEFERVTSLTYDDSNAWHQKECVHLVLAFLQSYSMNDPAKSNEKFASIAERLQKVFTGNTKRVFGNSQITNAEPPERDPYWQESDWDEKRPK